MAWLSQGQIQSEHMAQYRLLTLMHFNSRIAILNLIFGPLFSIKGGPNASLVSVVYLSSVCLLSVTSWYHSETVQCSGLKFHRMAGQGVCSYDAKRHPKRRGRFCAEAVTVGVPPVSRRPR